MVGDNQYKLGEGFSLDWQTTGEKQDSRYKRRSPDTRFFLDFLNF
jgi:hypothetical protein